MNIINLLLFSSEKQLLVRGHHRNIYIYIATFFEFVRFSFEIFWKLRCLGGFHVQLVGGLSKKERKQKNDIESRSLLSQPMVTRYGYVVVVTVGKFLFSSSFFFFGVGAAWEGAENCTEGIYIKAGDM